ncbi:zinc finger protein 226 isoform X2 [Plutella xylostella]|uniref:zinc finger protein 226 isoform X2 n=1 Tax=Plutella xylostella TaxID=51655 RepID=UPI00203273BC|nr:zinc finger protein 226 isoform X2 [Plutella xylostella]
MIPISQCKRVSKQSWSLGKECDIKTISKQTSLPDKESIRKIKVSDSNVSKNGNINNDNDTMSKKHIEDDDNTHIEDDENEHIEDDDNEHIEDDDNKHIEDDNNEHIEDHENKHIEDDKNRHIEDDDNKHIEDDDRPPAVRVEPLPLMIPISHCKRVYSKQTRLPGKDSIKKMKLSDGNVSKNDNINNDNDTMSNKHIEDDDNKLIEDDDNEHIEDDDNKHIEDDDNEHIEDDDNEHIEDDDRPPAVSVEPLPLMITISQCKRVYSKKTRLPGKDSIKNIKLSDDNVSKNDNINNDNDTTSNKHIEDDDRLPAVRVEPLPLIIPISQCKRVSKQTSLPGKKRYIKIKGSRPKRLKFSKVWVSNEQAMRWHREELRRAREASLSFVHECAACERLFAEEEDLQTHVADAHSEEAGQYTCDVCLYRFPDQTKLKQHMEAHYINYKCKTCSFESRILAEMQKHVSDTHPNTKCLKCRNKFASKAELDLHFNLCETYKCSYCKVKFPFREMYMEHTQKHLADPDGIYCEVCDVFCSPSRYKEHLRTNMKHVSRDSFKHECEICHNKYPTARGLGQHMVGTHKRPGPHPCDLCQKSFFRKIRLLNHRAAVHKIGPGKVKKKREMDKMCETCGKRFMTGVALSSHRNSHTGEQPWRCPDCPAAFTSSSNLWLHRVKIHDKTVNRRENKPNKLCCDECGKQLSSPSKLKYHCDFYHLKKALPFQCTICDKYFRKATRLQKHARVHKRVPCEPCGQWFKDAEALNKHLKKHSLPSWKGPYKCRSCGGTYSNVPEHYKLKHLHLKKVDRVRIKNLFNLDKAVEVIWMDKKFSCDVCGKQFLSPSELKYHYDFYHLKKALPFQCTICDKYFRRASALRVHARTHMRPFPCEPCGKWFKDPEALDKHLKKHSLPSWKGPYKCRSCDVTYSARNNMYEHYKLKHLHLKKDDRVTIKNLFKLDKEVEVIRLENKLK